MSLFSIKLKTKNGNDIKKKETFTCFFRVKYKTGMRTIAEYTYRIIHSKGIDDPQRVLELKASKDVKSIEDLTLKVMLNFCHIIGQISKKNGIDPDFVLFISPDLDNNKNKAWRFLTDAFKRPKAEKDKKGNLITADVKLDWLEDYTADYESQWTKDNCKKLKIKKEELDLLKSFGDLNENTMFMTIDPNRDKVKYAKSLAVCAALQDRIDRNLQITEKQLIK